MWTDVCERRSAVRGTVRPRVVACAVVLLWLGCPLSAWSQQPRVSDDLLDALAGQWVLSGEITGKPTTHDVDASWVLNHRFLRLHERSRETTTEGEPQYEADVFIGWDSAGKRYVIHWMDVFGGGFSLRGFGQREDRAIPIAFASEDGRFHTTFAFDSDAGTWRWTMDLENDGQLRPFARLLMTRR
jgi:hypothetical protein